MCRDACVLCAGDNPWQVARHRLQIGAGRRRKGGPGNDSVTQSSESGCGSASAYSSSGSSYAPTGGRKRKTKANQTKRKRKRKGKGKDKAKAKAKTASRKSDKARGSGAGGSSRADRTDAGDAQRKEEDRRAVSLLMEFMTRAAGQTDAPLHAPCPTRALLSESKAFNCVATEDARNFRKYARISMNNRDVTDSLLNREILHPFPACARLAWNPVFSVSTINRSLMINPAPDKPLARGPSFYADDSRVIAESRALYKTILAARLPFDEDDNIEELIAAKEGNQNLRVRYLSDSKGYGVVANATIPKGAAICLYTGELMSVESYAKKNDQYEAMFSERGTTMHLKDGTPVTIKYAPDSPIRMTKYAAQVDVKIGRENVSYVVDARTVGNISRFINTADSGKQNNCAFRQHNHQISGTGYGFPVLYVYATATIHVGHQLLIDYGTETDQIIATGNSATTDAVDATAQAPVHNTLPQQESPTAVQFAPSRTADERRARTPDAAAAPPPGAMRRTPGGGVGGESVLRDWLADASHDAYDKAALPLPFYRTDMSDDNDSDYADMPKYPAVLPNSQSDVPTGTPGLLDIEATFAEFDESSEDAELAAVAWPPQEVRDMRRDGGESTLSMSPSPRAVSNDANRRSIDLGPDDAWRAAWVVRQERQVESPSQETSRSLSQRADPASAVNVPRKRIYVVDSRSSTPRIRRQDL